MKLAFGVLVALSIVVAIGCEGNIPTESMTEMASTGPPPPAPAPPGGSDTADTDGQAEATATAETAANAETPEPAPGAKDGAATETARVGVGVKGKDYGAAGFVTTPIQEYFRTGERIAFEIQIPSNMKPYKAAHDNKGPKTHEEFMNVIIKENGVQLPDLGPGEEYVYDPKSEQLLVKHPLK
jgi:hypothetical protein